MDEAKLHHGVALIEVSDPLLLTEIESDSILKRFIGERLSEHCIAVRPEACAEVIHRLQALGHMPSVMNGIQHQG